MEDESACSICAEEWCRERPPKFLPCLHEYCEVCIQALKDASQRCPACRTAIDWDAIPSVSALPTNENRLDPRPREHRAESAVHPGAPGGPLLGAAPGLDEDTELQLATMLSELESVRDVDDDMQLAMELSRAEAASRAGPGPSDRHDHFDEDFQRAVEESLRAAEAGPRQGRGRPPPPPMFPPAASGRRPEESADCDLDMAMAISMQEQADEEYARHLHRQQLASLADRFPSVPAQAAPGPPVPRCSALTAAACAGRDRDAAPAGRQGQGLPQRRSWAGAEAGAEATRPSVVRRLSKWLSDAVSKAFNPS